jgi:hypothetical protein
MGLAVTVPAISSWKYPLRSKLVGEVEQLTRVRYRPQEVTVLRIVIGELLEKLLEESFLNDVVLDDTRRTRNVVVNTEKLRGIEPVVLENIMAEAVECLNRCIGKLRHSVVTVPDDTVFHLPGCVPSKRVEQDILR